MRLSSPPESFTFLAEALPSPALEEPAAPLPPLDGLFFVSTFGLFLREGADSGGGSERSSSSSSSSSTTIASDVTLACAPLELDPFCGRDLGSGGVKYPSSSSSSLAVIMRFMDVDDAGASSVSLLAAPDELPAATAALAEEEDRKFVAEGPASEVADDVRGLKLTVRGEKHTNSNVSARCLAKSRSLSD